MEKSSLLLIDDCPDIVILIECMLEQIKDLDINLIVANNGKEGLDILQKENNIFLVLLDVQMPEMDGFEVAKKIKLEDKNKVLPIIFMTGINKDLNHMITGYECGAVDYIFKPIDLDTFKNKVKFFWELLQNTKRLELINSTNIKIIQDIKNILQNAPNQNNE